MWPMDCKGLQPWIEEPPSKMQSLSLRYRFCESYMVVMILFLLVLFLLRLWPHHLPCQDVLRRIQVILNFQLIISFEIQAWDLIFVFGFDKNNLYVKHKSCIKSAPVIPETWTWVRSATQARPLWQCGSRAFSRLTVNRSLTTLKRSQDRWEGSILTPWPIGSW